MADSKRENSGQNTATNANADFYPSHYLVRVSDLHAAVADFQAAGFYVTYGSKPDHAYNAMIYFERGGFIELFTPPLHGLKGKLQKFLAAVGARLGNPLLVRLQRWMRTTGLVDFALESRGPLSQALTAAREKGAKLGKIRPSARQQADGVTTRWELSSPDRADLPFVMGPYDPPPVLTDVMLAHANGVREIRGIMIATPQPAAYLDDLQRLLTGTIDVDVLHAHGFQVRVEPGSSHEYCGLLVDKVPQRGFLLHGLSLTSANHG